MSICNATKNAKDKILKVEEKTSNVIKTTQKKIQSNIQSQLKKINETLKTGLTDKIQKKKKEIEKGILKPYFDTKNKNFAKIIIVDICLLVVFIIFVYKIRPFYQKYFGVPLYTEEQFKRALDLPENSFSREELRKAQEYRKSFLDWYEHYKKEDPFSDYNTGKPDIERGNMLRDPMLFIIQHIIPYVIVAYIVWFIIKYIKYVIGAIWGFFVMMYQYATKKITCTLAEKWYIRLVTGWEQCDPKFNTYYQQWKNRFITRPIVQERISYLRGVENVKQSYQARYNVYSWKDWFNKLGDWVNEWKRIYIDLPLQELYLQIIDFHPVYVVRPYELLSNAVRKNADDLEGKGRTRDGKQCRCPSKKTFYSKARRFIKCKVPKKEKELREAYHKFLEGIRKIKKKYGDSIQIPTMDFPEFKNYVNNIASCENIDSIIEKRKKIGKFIWLFIFLFVIAVTLYSVYFNQPIWLQKLSTPVVSFSGSKIPKVYFQSISYMISGGLIFFFLILGYYSYIH